MSSFLTFIGVTLLLTLEGTLLARVILRTKGWLLPISFGLPIAAIMNVLIVCIFVAAHIAINVTSLGIAHGLIAIAIVISGQWLVGRKETSLTTAHHPLTTRSWLLILPSAFILLSSLIYGFSHAVLLPTFQYDSATNWTMRSEISFYQETLAFDTTEVRGMAKPQYPFLFHALQVTANQGQNMWNDTAANTILFFVSLSTFGALYLMLRRHMSLSMTLGVLGALCSIPLFAIHLGQGYADLNLAQYFLLALACLYLWDEEKAPQWLVLSGVMIAAGVWTKSEGTFFGLVPWLVTVAVIYLKDRPKRREILRASLISIVLSIPWHLFALTRGFLLTPHGSDFEISLHTEGFKDAVLGLFSRGSFGIGWYAILLITALVAVEAWKKRARKKDLWMLLWPGIVFLEVLFVYLMTPNVRFLLNAESYYRQMMVPAVMFVLAIALVHFRLAARARHAGTPSQI